MDHLTSTSCLALFFLLSFPSFLVAQSYYGINDLGLHTVSLSFSLDEEPEIGLGYNYRNFSPGSGNAVLDVQAEVEVSYDLKAFKLSTGLNYLSLDNDFQHKLGLGLGAHAYIQTDPDQAGGTPFIGVDVSAYPGYFNNRLSIAPKIGFRYGIPLNTGSLSTETLGDRVLVPVQEDGLIGASNNLNRNHFYAGVLADASFSANFPSKLTVGLNADLYRTVLLDTQAEEPREEEEGLRAWPGIRISTSF